MLGLARPVPSNADTNSQWRARWPAQGSQRAWEACPLSGSSAVLPRVLIRDRSFAGDYSTGSRDRHRSEPAPSLRRLDVASHAHIDRFTPTLSAEHNLGLTCDPIDGLVQVPCIVRHIPTASHARSIRTLVLTSSAVWLGCVCRSVTV